MCVFSLLLRQKDEEITSENITFFIVLFLSLNLCLKGVLEQSDVYFKRSETNTLNVI